MIDDTPNTYRCVCGTDVAGQRKTQNGVTYTEYLCGECGARTISRLDRVALRRAALVIGAMYSGEKNTMDDIRLYMDEDAELLEANCHAIVDTLWNECERLNKKVNFYWHDGGGVLYLWAMYALGLVVGIGIGMMSVYATIGR